LVLPDVFLKNERDARRLIKAMMQPSGGKVVQVLPMIMGERIGFYVKDLPDAEARELANDPRIFLIEASTAVKVQSATRSNELQWE
jgi:hypothetical protein